MVLAMLDIMPSYFLSLRLLYCWLSDSLLRQWLTGHNGTINGQGETWWKKYRQKLLNHTRGPLVQIMWSSGIVISNITLRDSPFWTLHPYDCKNVTIKNVTILAPLYDAPNTDGIDPGKCIPLICFFVNEINGLCHSWAWVCSVIFKKFYSFI